MEPWYLKKYNLNKTAILHTVLSIALMFSMIWFYAIVDQPLITPSIKSDSVIIKPHTPLRLVADQLSQTGLLQHPLVFLSWIYLNGLNRQIKAGEYEVNAQMTIRSLVNQLSKGQVKQHALTIIPGWTFKRLMQALNQHPALKHTLENKNAREIMEALGNIDQNPEARFFPDTYYFPRETTDLAFLKRAYDRFNEQLQTLWAERALDCPLSSVDEGLILASIIEKESDVPSEYAEIAGVYIRRLEKKMPLQADPTVLYGLDYQGRLTADLLAKPTPYNTYKNIGLPPSPIAIPSLEALKAAFNPKPGDTFYFVRSSTQKGHVFSKSFKEHQKAVQNYRQIQINAKRS